MLYATRCSITKLRRILIFLPYAQQTRHRVHFKSMPPQNACKFDSFDDAVSLFHRMLGMHPPPSVVELTKIIREIVKMKHYATAIYLCTLMETKGILPFTVTLNIMMNCYCHLGQVGFAFSVMGKILKLGYKPSVVSLTTLIKGLFISGKKLDACQIYDEIIVKWFHADE